MKLPKSYIKKYGGITKAAWKAFKASKGTTHKKSSLAGSHKKKTHAKKAVHHSSSTQLTLAKPHKKHYSMRGDSMRKGKNSIGSLIGAMVAGLGGALLGNIGANMIPIKNKLLQAAIPGAVGIGVGMTIGQKHPIAGDVGMGMMIGSGVSIVKQTIGKNIPLLAGDSSSLTITRGDIEQAHRDGIINDTEYQALLSAPQTALMGGPVSSFAGMGGPVSSFAGESDGFSKMHDAWN